jgi:[ribosomal protein S5]-alanine N-acetyltransferase
MDPHPDNPILTTRRLVIRPFQGDDVRAVHRILTEAFHEHFFDELAALESRRNWLAWSTLSQTWLPRLHQPPYGDRAVVRKSDDVLVGVVGLVPCLSPFDQIPELRSGSQPSGLWSTEMGLFWAISPANQRQGYASEAGQALIDFAFERLHVARIIATTEYENEASQGVMRKLGMRLCRNPQPDPFWLQVVGVKNHPEAR